MLVRILLPLVLLALSVGLLIWHAAAWQRARDGEDDAEEREFAWRQFRRRMQASGMLLLLAVAIFFGQLIPWRDRPSLFVFFWCGVLVLLLWMVLLALGDMVASRQRFNRLRRSRRVTQAQLEAEVQRLRDELRHGPGSELRNGDPPDRPG